MQLWLESGVKFLENETMTTKLIFLGGGNMAEAIFAGLIDNSSFIIEVIQRNPDKIIELSHKYPTIKITATLDYTPDPNDILFLAIKPQQAKDACLAIQDKLTNCLIVSVMAGVTSATITKWTNNLRIIRTMPNTPASIGQGITAIYATPAISKHEQKIVSDIFTTIGMVHIAADESVIDKIAPVSSSAVAFLYYFMEGLIDNAVTSFGFSHEEATKLVKQLVTGSNALLEANPDISISEQRCRVTSKKGATEQGIFTFERHQLHQITNEAMLNCYKRILEMAKEFE